MQDLTNQRTISGNFKNKIDFWQVLENKSAFTEGTIACDILFLNQFVNLKISAGMFISTNSPLENLLSQTYLSPVQTELDYIELRVNLLSKCKNLMKKFNQNSDEFAQLEKIAWLLRFQLYGFGQKLFQVGKILYALIAFRESGILEKPQMKEKFEKLAKENPDFASIISEFI